MSVWLDPLAEWDRAGRPLSTQEHDAPAGWGEYLGAVADDVFQSNPFQADRRATERLAADRGTVMVPGGGGVMMLDVTPSPRVSAAEATERTKGLGLTFSRPTSEYSLQQITRERERQLANERIFERARLDDNYGTGKWLAAGVTELLVSAADPLNIASGFLPLVGPARFAMMTARLGPGGAALAKGLIEGAAGATLLEPLVAGERRDWDPDYGLADSLINITVGGALGGGLHWLGSRIDRWRQGRSATPAAAGDMRPPDVPQGMAEAVDAVSPLTREATLRTAVAQLADDRRVDVDAIVRSDPDWRPPDVMRAIGEERRARLESPERMTDRLDRPHLEAAAREMAENARASLRDSLRPSPVPEDFAPSAEQMAEARRIARGQNPVAEGRGGQSLSQWVRKRGGIATDAVEAGDLRAQDLRGLSGLLRRPRERAMSQGGGRWAGHNPDDLALAATEAGFYPRERASGERVDLQQFMADLIDDAQGRRRVYAEDDVDAVRAIEARTYNEGIDQLLSEQGLDVRGMEPRELAWLLSLDESRLRREALARRHDTLTGEETLEALDIVDREIAESAEADELAAVELQAARREGFVPELEVDPELSQRLLTQRPITLDELEALHGDAERLAGPRPEADGHSGPSGPGAGRAAAPAERADAQPSADQVAPEPSGLRPDDAGAREARAVRTEGDAGPVQAEGLTAQGGADLAAAIDSLRSFSSTVAPKHFVDSIQGAGLLSGVVDPAGRLWRFGPTAPVHADFFADHRRVEPLFVELSAFATKDRGDLGILRPANVTAAQGRTIDALVANYRRAGFGEATLATKGDAAPLTRDDVEAHVQRQNSPESDLHADFEAARRAEADAARPEPSAQEELQAFMERYGEQLTDDERAELGNVARAFDDEAKAIEALARCQIGGAS